MRNFILLVICLSVISCQHKKTAKELNEYFYLKKPQLDQIVLRLKADKKLDSLFEIIPASGLPDIEQEYPAEFKILKDCGITHASSNKNVYPKGTKWYYFETNWPGKVPILLSCNLENTDDSLERKKGFYKKDEYSNEWWGLGDGWQMLQLVKEIDYFAQ